MDAGRTKQDGRPEASSVTLYLSQAEVHSLTRCTTASIQRTWLRRYRVPFADGPNGPLVLRRDASRVAKTIDYNEPADVAQLYLAPMMNNNEYRCEACGGVFIKGWSDEEAEEEYVTSFDDQDRAMVCADCYKMIMGSGK